MGNSKHVRAYHAGYLQQIRLFYQLLNSAAKNTKRRGAAASYVQM